MEDTKGKLVALTSNRRGRPFDFDLFVARVQEYVETNGSYENITKDSIIGKQVRSVRQSYKGKKGGIRLTEERLEKLKAIGFEWSSVSAEDKFKWFCKKVEEYIKKNGTIRSITQDPEIGVYASYMRSVYNGKFKRKLNPEMIKKLEEIGFTWKAEDWFEPLLQKLVEYKARVGSFYGVTKNKEIGGKVKEIRKAYRGLGTTRLTPEMIEKLNDIEFTWKEVPYEWLKTFVEKVKKYNQEHGSFRGIAKDPEIGNQVQTVRVAYKGNSNLKLPQEIICELNMIQFPWEGASKNWFNIFYEKLVEYKKEHGSFYAVTQDKEIGYTVGTVRQAYKGNRKQVLTPEMIEKLEEIGFPWDAGYGKLVKKTAERVKIRNKRQFDFDTFYKELMAYKMIFGDVEVPYYYKTKILNKNGIEIEYSLGVRVAGIRRSKKFLDDGKEVKAYKFSEEQYKKLDDIGFVWEPKKRDVFITFYNELKMFKEKFGHVKVPSLYFNEETRYSLGAIAGAVRRTKRLLDAGQIAEIYVFSDEQYKMLEDLGIRWDKYSAEKNHRFGG